MQIRKFHFTALVAAAFLGGLLGQVLVAAPAYSQARKYLTYFLVSGPTGSKGIESAVSDSQPQQNFYGSDGKIRIQIGTYTAPGERGLPMIGMSDNMGRLRMLFRLAGVNESPVIIMKDQTGRDRLVMGLQLSGDNAPFLSLIDETGKKHNIFGNF